MEKTKRKISPNLHILKLTFAYFATGMIIFLIAMVMAIWLIPDLIQAQTMRFPKGWYLTHLFLLGWVTMVAMGASFQITQVVMRTALYSKKLGVIQYYLYLFGVMGLIAGFFSSVKMIVVGGSCITIAVTLYVFNIVMTFIRKKEWNLFVFGVSLSLFAFLCTVLLGTAMGLSAVNGWNAHHYEEIFKSHMWVGIGGWVSGLIIVFSFKLLPMFYASTKKVTIASYWIIGLYHLGIWLQIISIWSYVKWVSVLAILILIISLGWFVVYLRKIRIQRRGKLPIGTVKVAYFLIPACFFFFFIWSLLNWIGVISFNFDKILIIIIVLGWFSPTILSYLFKIVPFLWWPHRYKTREEKKSAVLLHEMLPGRRMTLELCGYLAGIAIVVVGFICELSTLAVIGQMIAVCFVIIYIWELMRVFRY